MMNKSEITNVIGKGTFWYSLNAIVFKGLGITTTLLVIYKLSIYSYGLTALVLSIVPLFGIFLLPGLSEVVVSDIGIEKGRNNFGKVKNILINFFTLQSLLGILAWAILFFSANVIAGFYEGNITTMLRTISFSFLIGPIRNSLLILLEVELKFFLRSLYSIVEEGAKLAFIVLMFFVFDRGAVGVIWGHVLAPLVAIAVLAPLASEAGRELFSVKIKERMPLLGIVHFHGKWGVFSSYMGTFGNKIRLWIIQLILNTEAVGVFSVASGLYSHIATIIPLNRIIRPILPRLVEEKDRFLRIVSKSIKYQLLGSVLLGGGFAVVVPPIFVSFFPQYGESMALFRVMVFVMVPQAFSSIFSSVFFALRAQRSLFFARLAQVVFVVILSWLFISMFGVIGASYGFVATSVIFSIERYITLKKLDPRFKIVFRSFLRIDKDDKFIFSDIKNNLTKRFGWGLSKD